MRFLPNHRQVWALLVALAFCPVAAIHAQQAYSNVTAAAGGLVENESYRMYSTLGEVSIGMATADGGSLVAGFWTVLVTPETGTPIEDLDLALPDEFRLEANYPNPFNPETTIQYGLPVPKRVSLKVYDSVGRLVNELLNESKAAGTYRVRFDATNLPSGVYFYRLEAGEFSEMRSMLLVK